MKNLNTNILENLATKAFDLHQKIDLDKKRLLEVKKQIIDRSREKNISYNVPLSNDIVRINKFKESIAYSFDKDAFLQLDTNTRHKFINEDVVQAKLEYSFNKSKLEIFKSKSEFKDDKKYGKGKFIDPMGKIIEGILKNGKFLK